MKLVKFLTNLKNEQVSVELKNGTTVWGTVQNVSPSMNLILTEVTLSLPVSNKNQNHNYSAISSVYMNGELDAQNKSSSKLQYINIRGNTIRQIILPDSLNLDNLLIEDQNEYNKLRKRGKIINSSNKKRRRKLGVTSTNSNNDSSSTDGNSNKRIKK
ncbi:related to Small nuclear ribonucleoprotein Sm D1 [Saccharomycodes ludwigii]|uniref:Related to Small nuclear ribonucleoprotein Sm D1 n=1 Tax=Saccharomycodes ludwigii TaxID=36035 RepID=A0A376B947_9ASCO|nr:hypothetical protein SCDLUD_005073 [Saccharomycodes ludwigii]KAH3898745.1 hypothetical protein SCDLUD_005073 [Saccharomycodes ludwigii]SSD61213.1 related to Small nuclear ribonucleoprotein Sm D1 [Saccharomycodes ludwigii]